MPTGIGSAVAAVAVGLAVATSPAWAWEQHGASLGEFGLASSHVASLRSNGQSPEILSIYLMLGRYQ